MSGTRRIHKVLGAQEDLLFGFDKIKQLRNGKEVEVTPLAPLIYSDFNVNGLINLLDTPFEDGKIYNVNGFYPSEIAPYANITGGGRWIALADEPHSNFTGGTIVTLEALEAWKDAAIAAGGLTRQNLIETVGTFLNWSGSNTVTGAFVRCVDSDVNILYPEWFGAVGDGVADDRPPIQSALDLLLLNADRGGSIYFRTGATYSIKTTNPTYPQSGLVYDTSGFNIYQRGKLSLKGEWNKTTIRLDVPSPITHLFYIPLNTNFIEAHGIIFDANNLASYAFHANDQPHAYMHLNKCRFQKATQSSCTVSSFVSHFELCHFVLSNKGLEYFTGDNTTSTPQTSTTLTSCYALDNDTIGYDFGYLTYCTLNACACDDAELAYNFKIAYGVSMNGCGAERVGKLINVESYLGFCIDGFYALNAGSLNSAAPEPYLIEFKQGKDAAIAGVYVSSPARYYDYILASTSAVFGSENITVLDGSLDRYNTYQVSNSYERPIKLLRGDESFGDFTYSIADSAALDDWFKRFDNYTINHNVTLQLASGIYIITDQIAAHLQNIHGSGRLTLQGQSDRSLVVLKAPVGGLQFSDIKCDLFIRNLTIGSNAANSTASRVNFINCTNAILDNVLITTDGQVTGYASILNGSNLKLINGTIATGGYSQEPFAIDAESRIKMTPSDTSPTTGAWSAGMIQDRVTFTAGGSVGFVCIATGSPGTWKEYGAISV